MIERTEPTFTATIYIAGDLATARQVCREFCRIGLCVTVEATEFISTGGAEMGVRVGLLNYPRFPAEEGIILDNARSLADELRERLCQHSWLIVTPDETIWNSLREPAKPASSDLAARKDLSGQNVSLSISEGQIANAGATEGERVDRVVGRGGPEADR